VQSTWLTAVRRAETYDGRAATARSWLFGILACLMQERRRSFVRFARAALRLGSASEAYSSEHESRTDLERSLQGISEAKRTVLLLAEVEGYGCEEIATMLGVPVGTVWRRLHQARTELRSFLQLEGTP
jgi:RNA polymerase sigma factor (sigma-70 family)